MYRNLFLAIALFFYSCTSSKIETKRFSAPEKPSFFSKKEVLSFIVHQNFKGDLATKEHTLGKTTVRYGGLETLQKYHQIATQVNPTTFFLSLGSEIPVHGFSHLKSTYQTWDKALMGADSLDQISHGSKPFVLSNLIEIKTGKAFSSKELAPYSILKKSDISVGLAGVVDYQSFSEEEKNSIRGVYFQDPYVSLIELKDESSFNQTNIRVLMFRGSTQCQRKNQKELNLSCPQKDELLRLSQSYPNINMIFVSNASFKLGKIGASSIIGVSSDPQHVTVAHFDLKENTVLDSKEVKLCQDFFKKTMDCYVTNEENSPRYEFLHGQDEIELSPAFFWGKKL